MKIIIPARKNSKGFPYKNRKLLSFTLNTIPKNLEKDVYISTDDEEIISAVRDTDINVQNRIEGLSKDDTSTKDVVVDCTSNMSSNELVVMLYLTYPERTWKDVENAIKFFKDNNAKSLLCAMPVKTNPYLCMYREKDFKGSQIIKHDLYRRQDYPECFEISHFVCIFRKIELKYLNDNMYNNDTIFYEINRVIDVDENKDFEKLIFDDKNNCRNRN